MIVITRVVLYYESFHPFPLRAELRVFYIVICCVRHYILAALYQ